MTMKNLNRITLIFSFLSILNAVGSGVWFLSSQNDAVKQIPHLQTQQATNTQDIALIKEWQTYEDSRYAQILTELSKINTKLDEQQKELYGNLNQPDRQAPNDGKH